MAWNFRRRLPILGGLFRINFSKGGVSFSTGIRGANVTIGKNGTYLNTGIPGTGLYQRQKISSGVSNETILRNKSPFNGNSYSSQPFRGNSWFTDEEYDRIVAPSFDLIQFHNKILPNPFFQKVMRDSHFNIVISGKRLTSNSDILQQLIITDAIYCYQHIMPSFSMKEKRTFGLLWLFVKFLDGLNSPMCEYEWLDYSISQLSNGADDYVKSLNHTPMDFPHIFIVAELLSDNNTDELLLEYLLIMESFYRVALQQQKLKSYSAKLFQSQIQHLIVQYKNKIS